MNSQPLLSVVVPVHNEEHCLVELRRRLTAVLESLDPHFEVVLVDDGSTDASLDLLREFHGSDPRFRYLSLSRNFGHEAASTAGLECARGQAVVLMDADLQDPPELIHELVARWRDGHEMVVARRRSRSGESRFKRASAAVFYRLFALLSDVPIPRDTGDFRLIDRRLLNHFRELPERTRFVRALLPWLGFRHAEVEFDRAPRVAGQTKYNPLKLVMLSFQAFCGFSLAPLRLCMVVGFVTVAFSLMAAMAILVDKLFFGLDVEGYALLATGMFLLGGVQLTFLGVLGEYVGRIYREVQRRPLYVVQERAGAGPSASGAGSAR